MTLNNKAYLYNEAERFYVYNECTIDETASKLELNPKTICRWKAKGNWDQKREEFRKSKQAFHSELYEFARKLMRDISSDMDNGKKIDPGRMYAFTRMLPLIGKVKEYEDEAIAGEKQEKNKGLTPDLIKTIEEEILGIKHIDE